MAYSSSASHRNRKSSHKGSSSSGLKDIHVDEAVKLAVNIALENFAASDDRELEFPNCLSSTERAFIHRKALSLGYISKSKGKKSRRFLTVWKKDCSVKPRLSMPLALSQNSLYCIRALQQMFQLSKKEHMELLPGGQGSLSPLESGDGSGRNRRSIVFCNRIPTVPPRRNPSELDTFRCSLPVNERQDEILQLIRDHRVLLVLGETGSGKTTQIPQFILDECCRMEEPCRMYCTQPRRLAAIAVAERVAAERGESVGKTIGYQIRLESRFSPSTCLTFCTSGLFLRLLMAGDSSLATVTHVIVDEVHERDGLTDFLLIKLRDVLKTIPRLKLILSSAALDLDLFVNYFGNCPVIKLKGRQFEVQELFLEDVLWLTGFSTGDVMKYKEDTEKKEQNQRQLSEWCKAVEGSLPGDRARAHPQPAAHSQPWGQEDAATAQEDGEQVELWIQKEMNDCISRIFLHEDQEAFAQLFNLILYENVNVNYRQSETGSTPLMVAAGRGFVTQVEQLLNMGADLSLKAANGWTALDFAEYYGQTDTVDLLRSFIPLEGLSLDDSSLVQSSDAKLSTEEQELLKLYHQSFDDERVDLDLIMDLLDYICSTTAEGAVLIFLPGYEEIVSLRDRILYDDRRFSVHSQRYQVFTLHSDMQTSDQIKAMRTSPPGCRKIILSTNIAETSITINDVVFVIDSGKVKEKSFDTLSRVSMLKTVWISKASALQRKGRAGRCRPGICFHLFSRLRFSSMLEFQVPQLLRMPLQDLCLQTKLLAPSSCPIAEFLSKAPQPPAAHAIRNAVEMLKTIDAMDQCENLTDLGYHVADLPVEPHLGKMVLCAVVLRCLDPVLTIACTLAYRDPFILPSQSSLKQAALQCREHFAFSTFSDHMALLRVFQAWQKACKDGQERLFCEKNFLSPATMKMILGIRMQLLAHLRAIGFVQVRGGCDIRDLNMNSENWAVVKAALVAGMYPNVVHMNQETSQLSNKTEKKVLFHPTSVLSLSHNKEADSRQSSRVLPTDWLIYDEMSRGHRIASVRCCSVVTAVSIAIFGGCSRLPDSALQETAGEPKSSHGGQLGTRHSLRAHSLFHEESDSDWEEQSEMKVDDWLVFQMDSEAATQVFDLRRRWQSLFIRRMRWPSRPWSQQDEAILSTLVSVLTAEEQEAGLQQPRGIGQKPRRMGLEEELLTTSKDSKNRLQTPPHTNERSCRTPSGHPQPKSQSREDNPTSSATSSSSGVQNSSTDTTASSEKESHVVSPQAPPFSVRYFIMKSNNMRNIKISQQRGIWSTTPLNSRRLSRAFTSSDTIILIFSVQGSGHFQGYARMTSAVTRESCQDWGLMGLEGVFSVDWIQRQSLPFHCSQHILNPWNDNKKVQISRDGQELEPHAGSQLLLLWDRDSAAQ